MSGSHRSKPAEADQTEQGNKNRVYRANKKTRCIIQSSWSGSRAAKEDHTQEQNSCIIYPIIIKHTTTQNKRHVFCIGYFHKKTFRGALLKRTEGKKENWQMIILPPKHCTQQRYFDKFKGKAPATDQSTPAALETWSRSDGARQQKQSLQSQ